MQKKKKRENWEKLVIVAVGSHETVEMCSISIQVEFDWLKVIILWIWNIMM